MVRIVLSILLSLGILTAGPRPLFGQSAPLISTGSTWRYLDNGSNQGTAWRSPGFNDSSWASGPAQLGYGDGDEATLVSYGANAAAKYVTTYFRRTFSVTNPAAFASLQLRVLRDDGAIVYLNGSEVFRTNMAAGTVGHTTLAATAVAGTAEAAFVSVALSPTLLVAGSNVIAVEVHQSEPSSSDVSFDLELLGSGSVSLTRGPYLQLGTPTSIVVRWRTSAAVVGRVQFGPSPGVVAGSVQESSARTEHEVRLTGLLPDTLYYYSIGTPTATMAGDAGFYFRTSPPVGSERPTRIWVLGDSGTGEAAAGAVRDAYANFAGSRYTDLWLMLGDNAYTNGLDHEYQAAVFNMYQAMLRKTMLWPTYGNHDGYGSDSATQTGPYYDIFTLPRQGEAGGVASGTEAYYSFNYGNIHFVCLESFETNRSPTGAMLTWLQRDLAANTQPWVIVFFHHPPYSKGSHNSDVEIELVEMRQNALPILENFGVDLVLTGHSHAYERSFLLDGHYGGSTTFTEVMKKDGGSGRPDTSGAYEKPAYRMAPHEGAVYVVAGTGGKLAGGTLNHPAMYTSQLVLGSVVLDVQGNRLDATFLDSTGVRRDYFSIVKGTGGSPPPPTPAYGGTPATIPGRFQAENFDEGGQLVAYYDTTAGHKGYYRTNTDVDIAPSTDPDGGGYYVGWTKAGEWLTYTVNVTAPGTYTLQTRLAALGDGGRFYIEVDGTRIQPAIDVPNTGAWDAWQTRSGPSLSLSAGPHVLRVFLERVGSGNAVAGFNWFELGSGSSAPPPSSTPAYPDPTRPAAIPGVVQAENFDTGAAGAAYLDTTSHNSGGAYRSTAVDIAPSTDPQGGGYYVGWTKAGEWLTYTVQVTATGTYRLDTRYATFGDNGRFRIEVDGAPIASITLPNTTAWTEWRTFVGPSLSLTQGTHVLRVFMEQVGTGNAVAGFNWFQFVGPTP